VLEDTVFSVKALIYGDLTCLALSLIALESETCRFREVSNINHMEDVSNFPLLNKNTYADGYFILLRWLVLLFQLLSLIVGLQYGNLQVTLKTVSYFFALSAGKCELFGQVDRITHH